MREHDGKEPPKLRADIDGERDALVGRGDGNYVDVDAQGRFRIEKMIPGQRYNAEAYLETGGATDALFKNLVLAPGEVRDLGDIRTKLSH
jgi:hypothetical protein